LASVPYAGSPQPRDQPLNRSIATCWQIALPP